MWMDRVVETGALEGVLAAVRDGLSRMLVLRGEPGIGKTALLDTVVGRAGDTNRPIGPDTPALIIAGRARRSGLGV